MTIALIEKELRQHGGMIVLFLILTYCGMSFLHNNELLSLNGGSEFYLVAWMLLITLPLGCLVLGNALIATEFRQNTQVFLDGLPLPRWKLVVVKYLFGLATALLASSLLLVPMLLSAWKPEAMNWQFAALLAIKTASWTWFCWAVVFALSFLGRYRIAIGLAVVLGLMWAQQVGGVLVNRFGPFELISDRFAYERYEYPTSELVITGVLVVALTLVGFMLALVRDATLATMLSERMSSREKLVVFSLVLTGLMILGGIADRVEKMEPLDMPDSFDLADPLITISAAAAVATPTDAERKALQLHAESAAGSIRQAAEYLKIKKLPPLFLLHRRDLDNEQFQQGELDSRQGYLLRLNMLKTEPASVALRSQLIEKILDANQHFRLNSDGRGWILQGFAQWWPLHNRNKASVDVVALEAMSKEDNPQDDKPMMARTEITTDDLVHWKRFCKELDSDQDARSIASVGIQTIWQQDPLACREFLCATLGYTAPHDFRASVHDGWYNTPYLARSVLNTDMNAIAAKWSTALRSQSPVPAESKSP